MNPQPIVRGTPAYRKLSIALLMAGFTTFALLYGVQPLLPLFTAEYGVSAAEASMAVSLATGPMAVALLVAGVLSDRVGRRPLMIVSLFAAAGLTVISAILPGWDALLVMRLLTGLALAGIPSTAMAYITEEVDGGSVGAAMGLYIAGTAMGGMAGRLGASVLADVAGWRMALGLVGVVGLVAAILFWRLAPASHGFVAQRHDRASLMAGIGRLFRDKALPWIYAEAFLLMGAFVTVYNYAGFRLIAPPYALSHAQVGAIFLLYIVGSFSSAWVGGLAGRIGRRRIFWMPIAVLLGGVGLMATAPLPLIILGIAIINGGFFGAHSVASSWVGRRAGADRAQAASLYLFFYYLGSSILGSVGGVAWARGGWAGLSIFVGGLAALALAIAVRLIAVRPLPENMPTPPPGPVA